MKELPSNTNPKKSPRHDGLLQVVKLPEETIRALMFVRELKYVTDSELISQYKEAEVWRQEWFEGSGWEFTPDAESDKPELTLRLLSPYDSVVDTASCGGGPAGPVGGALEGRAPRRGPSVSPSAPAGRCLAPGTSDPAPGGWARWPASDVDSESTSRSGPRGIELPPPRAAVRQ